MSLSQCKRSQLTGVVFILIFWIWGGIFGVFVSIYQIWLMQRTSWEICAHTHTHTRTNQWHGQNGLLLGYTVARWRRGERTEHFFKRLRRGKTSSARFLYRLQEWTTGFFHLRKMSVMFDCIKGLDAGRFDWLPGCCWVIAI